MSESELPAGEPSEEGFPVPGDTAPGDTVPADTAPAEPEALAAEGAEGAEDDGLAGISFDVTDADGSAETADAADAVGSADAAGAADSGEGDGEEPDPVADFKIGRAHV